MHRFAAEELANGRAQHRAPVRGARIRGQSGAFELQLPALARAVDQLTERDRATIPELPCPLAELMAAVIRGVRLHACEQCVPAKHLRELGRGHFCFVEAETLGQLARVRDQLRGTYGRRVDARVQCPVYLARPAAGVRIAGQIADEGIVERWSFHVSWSETFADRPDGRKIPTWTTL
jgi:hypothetical protein